MALIMFNDYIPSTHNHYGLEPSELWIAPAERSLVRSLGNLEKQCMRSALSKLDGLAKSSHIGKDGFQVSLDVQHFSPNEISVKTVDNSIVVEAKHEERQDEHGYISRQFCRRYTLPEGFKAEDVVSSISSDGILTVKAPPAKLAVEGPNVRQVEIQQTGPAKISIGTGNNNEESVTSTKDSK